MKIDFRFQYIPSKLFSIHYARVSRVPIFETRFRVWDCLRCIFEADSESESGPLMNIEIETESETSLKTRISVFRVRFSLFPLKSFNLCPYSNINTAQNVMTSPRPSPSLEHLWISRPSLRPKRVLDRETRPFESGTRDSGNSGW